METLSLKFIVHITASKYFAEVTYLEREVISPSLSKIHDIINDFIIHIADKDLIPKTYTNRNMNSFYLEWKFRTAKGSHTEKICIFDGHGTSSEDNVWYYKSGTWFSDAELAENKKCIEEISKRIKNIYDELMATNYMD